MLTKITKNEKRGHVHERIRKKLQGTAERPRLNVYRSLNHIYVQVIDDLNVNVIQRTINIQPRPLGGAEDLFANALMHSPSGYVFR